MQKPNVEKSEVRSDLKQIKPFLLTSCDKSMQLSLYIEAFPFYLKDALLYVLPSWAVQALICVYLKGYGI